MTDFRPAASRIRFLLVGLIILSLTLWVRTSNLYSLPVFVDEGNHILWAQRFAQGNTHYPLLMDGKILLIVTLSLFRIVGPAALWVSRAAIAIFATLGCSAAIATGNHVGSPRIGLLSGVIYTFLPFAVFHDRQVLADPLMADFGAIAVFLALRAAGPRGGRVVLPLALSLAAVLLVKLFGVTYFAFLAFAVFLLPASWKHRQTLITRYAAAGILALVLIGGFLAVLHSRLGYNDGTLANQNVGFVGCPAIVCQGDLGRQLDNLQAAVQSVTDFMPPYFGWPLVALALAAWPAAYKRDRRKIAVLGLSALTILIGLMFGVGTGSDIVLPARYTTMLAMPVAVLAAYGLLVIADRVASLIKTPLTSQHPSLFALATASLLLLILVIPPLTNMAPMILNPRKGAYPAFDLWQYFDGRYGGYGFYEAVSTIKARETNSPLQPVIIVYGEYVQMVGAYFDRTRVDVRAAGEVYPPEIGRWLADGQSIYLIDEIDPSLPSAPSPTSEGMLSREIARYRRHPYWGQEWTVRLRLATGAGPELRNRIYPEFFIRPEKLISEFRFLVDSLPQTGPVALLIYPPNQAAALAPLAAANRPNVTLIPIGDSWPLDIAASANELSHIAANHATVRMVFVGETKGDPQRQIETWLNTHLFRLDEQWFGPVRLLGFARGGEVTQTIPVGAQFGDGVRLESIDVLDSTSTPGGLVRLRLNWQVLTPIAQQFKIFTHIFAGDRIIAQHDGQPVGELRPTNTWQAGETIRDQLAVRLLPDVQPGDYQLRIGLYNLSTQARLPMSLPDGTTGEFFVGGQIVVK